VLRFILCFVLAFVASLGLVYCTGGVAAEVFEGLLSAFIVLALLLGAASYSLFTYVDSIAKDIAHDEKAKNSAAYLDTVASLSALKKEVLVNAFATAGLLLVERIAHGFALVSQSEADFSWAWAVATSTRMACFASSVLLVGVQFHGFLIASQFRDVMSRGK
jgi:hypothetical protein